MLVIISIITMIIILNIVIIIFSINNKNNTDNLNRENCPRHLLEKKAERKFDFSACFFPTQYCVWGCDAE